MILLWAVLWPTVQAQDFEVTYNHISVEEGLAGAAVYCAFQDEDGYIWFGTETGVSRYNGKRFENFSTADGLGDNEIFKIVQDRLGRVWFSAFNGELSYFLNGKFYNPANAPVLANAKVESHFNDLLVDHAGIIWVSTVLHGVVSIKPSGEVYYYREKLGDDGLAILLREEDDGFVWAIHNLYGDIRLEESMARPELLPESKETDELFNQLLGIHLPGREAQLIRPSTVYKKFINTLANKNKFWMSDMTKWHFYGNESWHCSYSGAYRLDAESNEVSTYLKDYSVTHVLKDREGSYWFTTLGNGIFYASSLESKSIRNDQSPMLKGITALKKGEDGIVYFGGNHGTFGVIEKGSIKASQMESPVNRSMVKQIEYGYRKDQFFLGSDNALIEVVDGKITRTTRLLAKSIVKWKDDLYAIGTNHRLLIMNSGQIDALLNASPEVFIKEKPERQPSVFSEYVSQWHHWILDIKPYKDGLLLGTLSGIYFVNADYEPIPLEGHNHLQKRINDISVLREGRSFAVATHGYGVLIKTENGWISLTEKDGLRSGISRKIWFDHPDTLWVASNAGIDRVIMGDDIQIKNITQSDGLLSEDVHDVLVSGDQLVAATSAGISLVDLPKWEQGKGAPLINLQNVSVDGIQSTGDSIQVGFDNKEVHIEYDGIHFASMEQLGYRYRMLGLDDAWQTTRNDEITFGRLFPGTYTFEVQAINTDQVLSEETVRLTLIIARPFWWQLWFIILAPLVVIVLIVLLTRYYVHRSRVKTQRELEVKLQISETQRRLLKAQVKPHFTYNILNSIQNLILKEETAKAYEFMGEFAALMRKDLDAYDQNSISLSEELELLESYLRLEKLRFQENEWEYEIVLDKGISSDQIQVPPMFLQPFVENTIKHGFAQVDYPGKILIKGYADEKHLNFEVLDNGCGLGSNPKTAYASKGIGIVRKRLQLVNDLNQVMINNREDGQGVRVSIQMTR